jgi:hypothetical protein
MSTFEIVVTGLTGLGALEALMAVVRKIRLRRKAKRDFHQLVGGLQKLNDC